VVRALRTQVVRLGLLHNADDLPRQLPLVVDSGHHAGSGGGARRARVIVLGARCCTFRW
jgi:hypothetical protein